VWWRWGRLERAVDWKREMSRSRYDFFLADTVFL
jgi:hypothetical protein